MPSRSPKKPNPNPGPVAARQRAESAGRRAEMLAALYLRLKGYRILGRRVRMSAGEIDLVLRRRNLIVFVEVKHRPTLEDGLYAVTAHQQARISRAAQSYIAAHPGLTGYDQRFDIVVVTGWRRVHHVLNAWGI